MTKLLWILSLVLATLWLQATPAWAEDDAVEAFRQGRVHETVERDLDAAARQYERALALDPDGSVGFEAAWAAARVQEGRGRTSEALVVLRVLTKRFADRLTEAQKREVHDAFLRLLPPGSRETSPLGTIYVPATTEGAQPGTSPLRQKIREMLDRYVEVGRADPEGVRTDIYYQLQAVGTDALPVLAALAREASASRATVAVDLLAQLGQAEALTALVDLGTQGDAFTRQAAVKAFKNYRGGARVPREPVVAALDAMLALDLSDGERLTLRKVLDDHLTPAARLERHLAGGDWAAYWLDRALVTKAPGALARAHELVRAGGAEGRRALIALLPHLLPNGNQPSTYPAGSFLAADAALGLDLLLTAPWTGPDGSSWPLVQLVRVTEQTSSEAAAEEARGRIWRAVAAIESAEERKRVADLLDSQGVIPPASMLADAEFVRMLFELVARRGGRSNLYSGLVALGPPFWNAFFDTLPHLAAPYAQGLLQRLQANLPQGPSGHGSLPPTYDRRWVDLLSRLELENDDWGIPRFLVQAAARSNDPRFLDLVRKNTLGRRWHPRHLHWLDDLREYDGPGLLAFVEDALKDGAFPQLRANSLLSSLADDASPGARELLLRIAGDWRHPLSRTALRYVKADDNGAALLGIIRRVQEGPDEIPSHYRNDLILAVKRLYLRAGVPYLIDEFRRGPLAKNAADAMDAIRAYHDRLETFKRFGKGGGESGRAAPKRKVEDLLEDPDAAIRRAAVIALGALGRTDALDRLVYLAKEDPDAAVRRAALEAVEKIAAD